MKHALKLLFSCLCMQIDVMFCCHVVLKLSFRAWCIWYDRYCIGLSKWHVWDYFSMFVAGKCIWYTMTTVILVTGCTSSPWAQRRALWRMTTINARWRVPLLGIPRWQPLRPWQPNRHPSRLQPHFYEFWPLFEWLCLYED